MEKMEKRRKRRRTRKTAELNRELCAVCTCTIFHPSRHFTNAFYLQVNDRNFPKISFNIATFGFPRERSQAATTLCLKLSESTRRQRRTHCVEARPEIQREEKKNTFPTNKTLESASGIYSLCSHTHTHLRWAKSA